jgi:hypothetical protein
MPALLPGARHRHEPIRRHIPRSAGKPPTSTLLKDPGRPGLARAAIKLDWHEWSTERAATSIWLKRITAPDGEAADWLEQIGDRLLDLSLTAVNPPFFEVLESWIGPSTVRDGERLATIAALLTKASATTRFGRATHQKLLDWASSSRPGHRAVVATTCAGEYGRQLPRKAFTRLRWILNNEVQDEATNIAAETLIDHAQANDEELTRVVQAVESWIGKDQLAGARAFLALVDATPGNGIAPSLLNAGRFSSSLRDFLVSGWISSLRQDTLRERAHQVLLSWAGAVRDQILDRDFAFGILSSARDAHLPRDAMSRFLYGSPEQEDIGLIEARHALANLRACNHARCDRADCPLIQSAGSQQVHENENEGEAAAEAPA